MSNIDSSVDSRIKNISLRLSIPQAQTSNDSYDDIDNEDLDTYGSFSGSSTDFTSPLTTRPPMSLPPPQLLSDTSKRVAPFESLKTRRDVKPPASSLPPGDVKVNGSAPSANGTTANRSSNTHTNGKVAKKTVKPPGYNHVNNSRSASAAFDGSLSPTHILQVFTSEERLPKLPFSIPELEPGREQEILQKQKKQLLEDAFGNDAEMNDSHEIDSMIEQEFTKAAEIEETPAPAPKEKSGFKLGSQNEQKEKGGLEDFFGPESDEDNEKEADEYRKFAERSTKQEGPKKVEKVEAKPTSPKAKVTWIVKPPPIKKDQEPEIKASLPQPAEEKNQEPVKDEKSSNKKKSQLRVPNSYQANTSGAAEASLDVKPVQTDSKPLSPRPKVEEKPEKSIKKPEVDVKPSEVKREPEKKEAKESTKEKKSKEDEKKSKSEKQAEPKEKESKETKSREKSKESKEVKDSKEIRSSRDKKEKERSPSPERRRSERSRSTSSTEKRESSVGTSKERDDRKDKRKEESRRERESESSRERERRDRDRKKRDDDKRTTQESSRDEDRRKSREEDKRKRDRSPGSKRSRDDDSDEGESSKRRRRHDEESSRSPSRSKEERREKRDAKEAKRDEKRDDKRDDKRDKKDDSKLKREREATSSGEPDAKKSRYDSPKKQQSLNELLEQAKNYKKQADNEKDKSRSAYLYLRAVVHYVRACDLSPQMHQTMVHFLRQVVNGFVGKEFFSKPKLGLFYLCQSFMLYKTLLSAKDSLLKKQKETAHIVETLKKSHHGHSSSSTSTSSKSSPSGDGSPSSSQVAASMDLVKAFPLFTESIEMFHQYLDTFKLSQEFIGAAGFELSPFHRDLGCTHEALASYLEQCLAKEIS